MNTNYDINELIELSKIKKSGYVVLSDGRYALKEVEDGKFCLCDGKRLLFATPQVKRIISIYGDDIDDANISIDYTIVDMPMFSKKAIEDSNMIPLHSKDVSNYFEVTDTVIMHNKYKDDAKNVREEIKHEDSVYYATKRMIDLVESKINSVEE